MGRAGGAKTGGRQKGTPNRATADVRAMIARVAEGKAADFERWLDETARGGEDRKPDPAKAAELYLKAIEYHIPKLARTEHTGAGGGPVAVQTVEWSVKKPGEAGA